MNRVWPILMPRKLTCHINLLIVCFNFSLTLNCTDKLEHQDTHNSSYKEDHEIVFSANNYITSRELATEWHFN